ncbi:MAG: hypothetical protein ABF636_12330, partial [Acetobacter sp.]
MSAPLNRPQQSTPASSHLARPTRSTKGCVVECTVGCTAGAIGHVPVRVVERRAVWCGGGGGGGGPPPPPAPGGGG